MDADGDVDLVGGGADGLKLYKATGGGSYATAVSADINNALNTYYIFDIVLGDFSGDSKLDAVVMGLKIGAGNDILILLKNGGTGTFTTSSTILSDAYLTELPIAGLGVGHLRAKGILAADLNGDNKLDLATNQPNNPILFGDGAGNFGTTSNDRGSISPNSAGSASYSGQITCTTANPPFATTSSCTGSWVAGDFDGDGDIDLVLVRPFAYDLLYESHKGKLKDTPRPLGTTSNSLSERIAATNNVATADVDGDGDLDFLLVRLGSAELHVSSFCPSSARSATGACFMCPTFAARAYMADRCEECAAHYVTGGTSLCSPCPSGKERLTNFHDCNACVAGKAGGLGLPCTDCPAGEIAAASELRMCTKCAPGSYSPSAGQSACIVCPIGSYCVEGAMQPQSCAAGRYGSTTSRIDDQCNGACAVGHYCPNGTISPTLYPCPAGTYNPNLGRGSLDQCTPCDYGSFCVEASAQPALCEDTLPNSITRYQRSKSAQDCICLPSFYMRKNSSAPDSLGECVPCPKGVQCVDIGNQLETIEILQGHWRQTNRSEGVHIKRCFNADSCPGGNITIPFQGTKCTPGHIGPYCSICESNWFGGSENKPCKFCQGDLTLSFVPIFVLLAILVALVLAWFLGGDKVRGTVQSTGASLARAATRGNLQAEMKKSGKALLNRQATASQTSLAGGKTKMSIGSKVKAYIVVCIAKVVGFIGKFQVKLKILISLIQIINNMGFVFSIPYPDYFTSSMETVGSVFEIEMPQLMPMDCMIPMNFFGKLVLRTVLPLVVYALLLSISMVLRKKNLPAQADAMVDGIFFIMFLIYRA